MSRLSVELVPSTCWWSNVRSEVSAKEWNVCKKYVRVRSNDRCEVCGERGPRWPVECHEIWSYDDDRAIQKLDGLIALCPRCHEVKHIGRAFAIGRGAEAIEHLCLINRWRPEHAEAYLEVVFEVHALRSSHQWSLDITFLHTLGIYPTTHERQA